MLPPTQQTSGDLSSDKTSFQVSWRTIAAGHEVIINCCFIDFVGWCEEKKKERGKQEVQSVRVFFYVIIHTATRESSLCCPGWQSDVSAVTSKNRVNRVSVVSLRIHYPWVFNALLCRMLLPVTHNSRRAQREKKTLQQTDQPREKSATFLVKQIASGCDLTHGDKSSLLYKSHKRRATE